MEVENQKPNNSALAAFGFEVSFPFHHVLHALTSLQDSQAPCVASRILEAGGNFGHVTQWSGWRSLGFLDDMDGAGFSEVDIRSSQRLEQFQKIKKFI